MYVKLMYSNSTVDHLFADFIGLISEWITFNVDKTWMCFRHQELRSSVVYYVPSVVVYKKLARNAVEKHPIYQPPPLLFYL